MKRLRIPSKYWKYIALIILLISIIAIISFILHNISSDLSLSYQEKRRYSFLIIIGSVIGVLVGTSGGGYVYKHRRYIIKELKILILKLRVRKGDKKYKKGKFLLAYKIYQSTLNKCKKLRNSRNLIEKIKKKETDTLKQFEILIYTQMQQTLKKIEKLKENGKHTLIIEKCEEFFKFLEPYPKTTEIEKERELIKKEYNISIESICEIQHNIIRPEIRELLKKRNYEKVIESGKKFLTSIEKHPDVKGVRLARDGIIMLIEPPITQKWEEKYQKIRQEIRTPGTPREFQHAYKLIDSFFLETEEDKNFPEVERLRNKIQNKYRRIKTLEPRIIKEEKYEGLVSKAQKNFEKGIYQRAIYFTQKAIELVKDPNLEEISIAVNKDTSTHVILAQFKFYCMDKINERDINRLIDKANELYSKGEIVKSKALLQKTLELHGQLSDLYKELEGRRHRELFEVIRRGLNRE